MPEGNRVQSRDNGPEPVGILVEGQIPDAPYRSSPVAGKARQQANATRPCHQKPSPVTTSQLPESSMGNRYGNHFTGE